MYETIVRLRWLIAAFVVVTVGSIVTYVNRPAGDAAILSASRGPQVEIAGAGSPDEGDVSQPARPGEVIDPLIDRTIGEDVRPEEEKQAEAAALAALANQARMQPAPADGEDAASAE